MNEYKNVLVFGEMDEEKLSSVTAQVMRIGKTLSSDLNEELHLLLLGSNAQGAEQGNHHGHVLVGPAANVANGQIPRYQV